IEEGYRTSLTIPMYGQGAFTGMLFFDSRRPDAFSGAEQRHLELYANLVSLLIAGELLTIRALAGSVDVARAFCDLRDFETGTHLERMSRYARIAAKELAPDRNLTDEFVELVFLFAPLHDVGKIGIPDHILLRPGPLAGLDWETMKTHVDRGSAVLDKMIADLALRELPHVTLLRNIVAYHHEFLDGSGYPQGARGDAIPLEARIVTVADVFDALTSPRPYKPAWPFPEAFAELDRMVAAGKLDGTVVAALRRRADEVRAVRERYVDERKGAARP
ncbi:MAG TPA: HD domain-containing protein, partial [Kiritimatiellia bacterium]|nr:HD domain-containing protein [Kiritimatiellia bacterium]